MTITVSDHVTSTSLTISAGDPLVVLLGGLAISTTVLHGAEDDVYGSAALTTLAGTEQVSSGGVASGTTVKNGGIEIVNHGGVASATVVSSGGQQWVSGFAAATVVSSGGSEILFGSGATSGAEILSGGKFHPTLILSGQSLTAGLDVAASAYEFDGATISRGGILNLNGVGLQSGGSLSLAPGALVSNLTISSGGKLSGQGQIVGDDQDYGLVSGVTLGNSSAVGSLHVELGGVATAVTLVDGAAEYISAGGDASGGVVSSGQVYVGGVAVGTVLSQNGAQHVQYRGVASGTLVKGGSEDIARGGLTKQTVVSSAGTEVVSAGGVASGLSLLSGGALVDDGAVRVAAARTFAGSVSGSGALAVLDSGDLILSGAGSAFTGRAVINGGTIELATSGAIGTGSAVFAGGTASKTLRIDAADAPAAGGTFANALSNFAATSDLIDLRSVAFVAGAAAVVSGTTLVLTDGGKTYKFNLSGGIGGGFAVTSDGHGGTQIRVSLAGFAQAAAGLATSGGPVLANAAGAGTSGFAPLLHGTTSASGRG